MTDIVPSVPVTLVVNSYFDELTYSIRARPMPWEGYQKASLIDGAELALLKQAQQANNITPDYVRLLVKLLDKLVRVDTLQYILVLIDDILDQDEKAASYLHDMSDHYPYDPLLKCLKKGDDFLSLKAGKILTYLICTSTAPIPESCSEFLDTLIFQLSNSNANVSDITVQLIQSLLNVPAYRGDFYNKARAVPNLLALLSKDRVNPQIQYQIIYCFWLLTFETEIAEDIDEQHSIIATLIRIAKVTVKEKIIRVIVGTFKNLLSLAPDHNITAMLGHKLLPFIENLSTRKWTDSEIVEDLNYLKDELTQVVQGLTTFDAYKTEVESGQLEWSPPHQSQQFWQANATKLEEDDLALLKSLSDIISTSTDPIVLSVAAFDIGQYVKSSPRGKKYVEEVGAKRKVMELMNHSHPDVKYQALVAVQTLLMHSW